MKDYEVLFVIDPSQDEQSRKEYIDAVKEIIDSDGQVMDVDYWGEKRLAYRIKGTNKGFYCVITFKANVTLPKELDRKLRINENIMRHIIVCKEEDK